MVYAQYNCHGTILLANSFFFLKQDKTIDVMQCYKSIHIVYTNRYFWNEDNASRFGHMTMLFSTMFKTFDKQSALILCSRTSVMLFGARRSPSPDSMFPQYKYLLVDSVSTSVFGMGVSFIVPFPDHYLLLPFDNGLIPQ